MNRLLLFLFLFPMGILLAEDFNPIRVVPAFEAIVKSKTVDSDESGKWIRDDELVLGVVVNGAARA